MADKDNPGSAPKQPLQQDSLVKQLVPDPGKLQATIQLTGWLGKGQEEGTWNLYSSPRFDEYVQFSEKDVVYSQQIPPEHAPLGGTKIWLRASTVLHHVQVITRQVQGSFLSGGITSAHMGEALSSLPVAGPGHKGPAVLSVGYQCSINPHIPVCAPPTQNCYVSKIDCTIEPIDCGSRNAFCNTREFVC